MYFVLNEAPYDSDISKCNFYYVRLTDSAELAKSCLDNGMRVFKVEMKDFAEVQSINATYTEKYII